MRNIYALVHYLVLIAASSSRRRQTPLNPSVDIQNGTIIGSSSGVIESFKGIPYAEPPTGTRRLTPPTPLTTGFGTISATAVPTACPQLYFSTNTSSLPDSVLGQLLDNPFLQAAQIEGEDCLTINVQRPAGTNSTSRLPVLFWIYGGGFEFGSTQVYDGTGIITKSITLGQPIIYVAVNYRVGGFGFLSGKELSQQHSTNLGLRDQRLGMQWVQDNIAAFGGDPEKVVIWGESAGSVSVNDHLYINGGNNLYKGGKLFRGAIMDSGAINPTRSAVSPKAQAVYNSVVTAAGCGGVSDTLDCLRATNYSTYLAAVNSISSLLGYDAVNLAYVPRPDSSDNFFPLSPEVALRKGEYVRVPVIVGDQQDEGTLFSLSQTNLSTTAELVDYIASFFPGTPRSISQGLVDTYPNNPSAGSPYNTGPLYNIYPQYKRLASLTGDLVFNMKRRIYLDAASSNVPAWSYLATYEKGTPILGTFHATDIALLYLEAGSPIPQQSIYTYYTSFVNNLDPNAIVTTPPQIMWPKYTTTKRQLIEFGLLSNSIILDTFRKRSYIYIKKHLTALRL